MASIEEGVAFCLFAERGRNTTSSEGGRTTRAEF